MTRFFVKCVDLILTDADGLGLDDVLAVDAGENADGLGGELVSEEDQVEDRVDEQLDVVQNHQSDCKHQPETEDQGHDLTSLDIWCIRSMRGFLYFLACNSY